MVEALKGLNGPSKPYVTPIFTIKMSDRGGGILFIGKTKSFQCFDNKFARLLIIQCCGVVSYRQPTKRQFATEKMK